MKLILLVILALSSNAFGAIIGEFSDVFNAPGYIDLNPNSLLYKGLDTSKSNQLGPERRTPSKIVADFMQGNHIDVMRLQQFIHLLQDFKANIKISTCMEERRKKVDSYNDCIGKVDSKKFNQKWKRNKYRKAINFAISNLELARKDSLKITKSNINSPEAQRFLESLINAIEVYEAIRSEDEQMGKYANAIMRLSQAKEAIFSPNTIKANRPHATNLLIPSDYPIQDQLFFSPEQLKEYKAQGGDISKLDPPSTGMWRKPKKSISEFDTSNYDKQGVPQLKKLLPKGMVDKFLDQDEVINVRYKPHFIKGGKTPKFNVWIGDSKWKIKFITDKQGYRSQKNLFEEIGKYIVGSEANTEPVVNNLAAALGYTIDPTYYKKKVRLYFEEEVYEQGLFEDAHRDLKRNVRERYVGLMNTDSALSTVKTDENGKKYLEMKSITLESKSNTQTDMNLGFYVRDGFNKVFLREHRAFYNFLAWVADPDVKDDNDKTKIVPYTTQDGQESFKIMFSASDMGGALGFGFPNYYNTNFIKKVTRNKAGEVTELDLAYLRIFPFNLRKAVNIADTKWFARRMAQLSLAQVEKAFSSAGYPVVVSKYYALLMMRKRNQMLKALGMFGETFIDDGGKPFTITKAPEFTGTIAGFEEFFRNGHLTDKDNKLFNPEVENFHRNWGVSWRNIGLDMPQTKVLKTLKVNLIDSLMSLVHRGVFDRTMLTNTGFRFFNTRVFDNELGDVCQNNCFMQGLEFGVSHFIPMRYIVQNPNHDSDKPYWIVDLFRLGAFIGENGTLIQKLLGFDAPSFTRLGVGARLYNIAEFIRIHPTDNVEDYLKNKKNIFKMPKHLNYNHRKHFVESMQAGDSLIMSKYIGQKLGARIRPVAYMPLTGVRLGVENINLGRVTIHKGEDNTAYANWGYSDIFNTGASLNIIDTLFRIPLVSSTYSRLKNHDYSYLFHLDNPKEKELLLANLKANVPENIPKEYLSKERMQLRSERSNIATLFGLIGKKKYKRRIENRYYDYRSEVAYKNKTYEFERIKLKLKNFENATETTTGIAYINNEEEIELGYKLEVYDPVLNRVGFIRMMDHYKNILPDDIISFDPKYIKHYMGAVKMNVSAFFNKKTLKKFFDYDKSEFDLCVDYAKFLKQENPDLACGFTAGKSYKVKKYFRELFKKLWRQYVKNRESFNRLEKGSFTESRYKDLKTLAKFMSDKKLKLRIAEFLISLSKKKRFKRNVSIDSELYAFPGDIRLIEESPLEAGKYEPKESNSMQLFTDEIHEAVGSFFYNMMHAL